MLLNVLDDSDSGKIRKSIIITSVLLFIAYHYKIQITIPKALYSGDENLLTITNNSIINGLLIIQIYLLAKLWLSWSAELAIFERNWILDPYEGERDLSQAKSEIERFISYCKTQGFQKGFIKESDINIVTALQEECQNWERKLKNSQISNAKFEIITEKGLSQLLESFNSIKDLQAFINQLPEEKKHEGIERQIRKIWEEINQAKDSIETAELQIEDITKEYEDKLRSIKSIISTLLDIQNNYHDTSQDANEQLMRLRQKLSQVDSFIEAFPKSSFYDVIDLSENHLRKGKKNKRIEMYIFNLIIPSALGVLSVTAYCYYRC